MKKAHGARACLAAALLFLSACVPIELVSKYDAQTDESATTMQKDLTAFFVKLRTALTPTEQSFAANQDFYKKQAVNISAMKVRAVAIPKNSITRQQIGLVEENLAYLALLHKGCITQPLGDAQKTKVSEKGIDVSLDCRAEYGATSDIGNRGDSPLNPAVAGQTEKLLNIQLQAILKFEIAKKRGEKPDQEK